MLWEIHVGDLLDAPADVLVCSANVYLTLSGGVGGALLLRYGHAMQDSLSQYLADRNKRHVERGEIVVMQPFGSPYRAVLHAVAVDGLYETTPEILTGVIRGSLERAADLSAQTVALAALATGYGRKSIEFFGQALERVVDENFSPIERVVVGLRNREDVDKLRAVLPRLFVPAR
jgi:O-acetyl-ADP-ribose deacetylase (regulator of RNase III)